jgi:hypothetical protein
LYFAVNCQESLPAADPEIMAAQAAAYPELEGYVRHQAHIPICGAWDLPAAPPLVGEPVESDVPTLILAGAYDPITPPDWSQAVAENLSTSHYFEFPSAGHSVTTDNPCAESIVAAFLNDPANEPDPGCMANVPGPEFVLPEDVAIAASVYEIHYGEIGYTSLEHSLFLACILVFIAEISYLVVAGIVRLVRRREPETQPDPIARFAHPLAGLVAMLNVGFSLALRSVLRSTAATASLALRFGGRIGSHRGVSLDARLLVGSGAGLFHGSDAGSGSVCRPGGILGCAHIALLRAAALSLEREPVQPGSASVECQLQVMLVAQVCDRITMRFCVAGL